MNCNEYQQHISAMIDNELHDDEWETVFSHLGECGTCRNYLRSLLQLRSALAAQQVVVVPPTLDQRVLSIPLHTPVPAKPRYATLAAFWRNRLAIPVPAVAATLILLLVSFALSILFLSQQSDGKTPQQQKVVYIIGMQPIEVQGTYVSTNHDIQ